MNNMQWKFVVKRTLSVIFIEFITNGQTSKEIKKILDLDCGFDYNRNINTYVSYALEDLQNAKKQMQELLKEKGVSAYESLLKMWYQFMKELEDFAEKIHNTSYEDYSNEELVKEFTELKDKYNKASTALMVPLTIGNIMEEEIKKFLKNNQDKYFQILTAPIKENENTKELVSMLKISQKQKLGKDISKEIQDHINEFGWINTRGFLGDIWTKEEIQERVDAMQDENFDERLKMLDPNLVKLNTEKAIKELNIDNDFKKFINVAKEFVFFRTYRMDTFVKSGFIARPLFKEIAKRLNLDLQSIFHLMFEEIIDGLNTGKDYSVITAERKKAWGSVFIKSDKKVLSGKALEDYIKENPEEEVDSSLTIVKGSLASPGKVTGKARILFDKNEIYKIEKGDILITSMTTPDFVPAMEKAAAFVTDEGGILCHAAIVSREMNKPCIIGTKIATKVFKDGDLVEVDAEKGIIKKL